MTDIEDEDRRSYVLHESNRLKRRMMKAWCAWFVLWLIAEVLSAVAYLIMPIIISYLPQSYFSQFAIYQPVDFYKDVAPSIFTTTITVNGIIIGFASVCAFFHIDWIDRRIEIHERDLDEIFPHARTEQNMSEKDRKEYENSRSYKMTVKYLGTKFGFSEYVRRYVQISLVLILFQVFFFALTAVSIAFMSITFLLGVNSVVAIAIGLYSLLREVLWGPKFKKENGTRRGEEPSTGSSTQPVP